EPLGRALSDQSNYCRQVAAYALKDLQTQDSVDAEDMKPAIPALVAALGNSDSTVRYNAALALGASGDQRAAPVLLEMVGNSAAGRQNFSSFTSAPTYLGQLKVASTYNPLEKLLTDGRPATRAGAATALGLLGDQRAVGPLMIRLEP